MENQGELHTLWDYDQVAAYLGASRASVRNRVYRGQIPFVRVGARTVRFDPVRIAGWLAGREGLRASACSTTPPCSTATATSKGTKIERTRKQAKADVNGGQNFNTRPTMGPTKARAAR